LQKLCERLNSFALAVVLDRKTPGGTLWADSIEVLTMAGSRGLQFRIVVLLWAGALPSQFKAHASGADRSPLYVAMTRAEDMLGILHSGHSTHIDEQIPTVAFAPKQSCAEPDAFRYIFSRPDDLLIFFSFSPQKKAPFRRTVHWPISRRWSGTREG
jgi:superfamily I DNA/RNA helicase